YSLLISQRVHRIGLRRPPCGDIAGQESYNSQQDRDAYQSGYIERRDSIEQASNESASRAAPTKPRQIPILTSFAASPRTSRSIDPLSAVVCMELAKSCTPNLEACSAGTQTRVPISSLTLIRLYRIGEGVKQSTSISSAHQARMTRERSSGRVSKITGCRSANKSNSPAMMYHVQLFVTRPSTTSATTKIRDRSLWRSPMTEYRIWPPSSCPMGNRLSAVANMPTHAASAIGCR